MSELNQIVGVEVSVQDGGTYNITMANGYSLVQGSTARQLAAVPSSADPSRTTVAYVDGTAGNIEIPEKLLNTGSLGGILTFRSQDLDQTRNTLDNWRWHLPRLSTPNTKPDLMLTAMPVKISLLSVSPRFCKTRKTKVTLRSVQR